MPIIRFDPFFRPRWLRPFLSWDEEEEENWPELTMTEGLDVYEEEDRVIVKAAVPGIPSDKVEVTFEDGVLRIRAKVEEKEEEKKKRKVVYRMDRVASFDYTTTLPRPVDEKSIEAKVENGVVVISAKIAEEAKPKKIPVKVAGK
ncbi:MAG: Hsp20/alpha crystallin family protein [Patescibacteria group bacterium]|nr:Hsp20/alpha crystallin family protein [Patescibacteria group bacterium]